VFEIRIANVFTGKSIKRKELNKNWKEKFETRRKMKEK
jgi:hypothetical protein